MWVTDWAHAGEPTVLGLVLHRAEHAVWFERLLIRRGLKERDHTLRNQETGETIRVQLPAELLGADTDRSLRNIALKEGP